VQNVVMVGGLAGSAYIYAQLQQWATAYGMKISRPDGPTYVTSFVVAPLAGR
jgi:hypothetical protein